ncbi:Membrane protein [Neisseria meningitidis]|nr:Membrane protein [Neisseria meningitidis]CKK76592.1 Membrane protein [Neisseria meningitidis]CKL08343.1 Membrane protein [Neisseria meningitidis]
MWEQPLDRLSEKQISSFGKLGAQEQLDLLGGANAFETRDKQCVADLKSE